MSDKDNKTKYVLANSIDNVIKILSVNHNAKIIAGGTDIIPNYKQKNIQPDLFVDISSVSGLHQIYCDSNEIRIGACVKISQIISHKEIQNNVKILSDAAKSIATPVIRKNATIAGNLLCENRCIFYNQSEWWRESIGKCLKCDGDICIATGGKKNCFSKSSSDLAPSLIVCDAEISIQNTLGTKRIPLKELYSGDGINPFNINPSDLITSIHIPITKRKYFYYKLRQRSSIDFSSLTIAVAYNTESHSIVTCIGSCDPQPVSWKFSLDNQINFQDIIKQKVKKIRLVNNDFYSRDYRKYVLIKKLEEIYIQILKHEI